MIKRFRNKDTGVLFWASPSSEPPLSFFESLSGLFEEVHEEEVQVPSFLEDQEEEKPLRITGEEPSESADTASRLALEETNQQLKHPKGNASKAAWLEFAQEQDPEADLTGMTRDELRRRFG